MPRHGRALDCFGIPHFPLCSTNPHSSHKVSCIPALPAEKKKAVTGIEPFAPSERKRPFEESARKKCPTELPAHKRKVARDKNLQTRKKPALRTKQKKQPDKTKKTGSFCLSFLLVSAGRSPYRLDCFASETASRMLFPFASLPYLSTSRRLRSPCVRQPAPPTHPP